MKTKRLVVLLGLCLAGSLALAQAPDPAELERYAADGKLALAERRFEDAARAFEKLRELSPETAEIHAQLGMIRFQQRDFGQAVPSLQEALRLKPARLFVIRRGTVIAETQPVVSRLSLSDRTYEVDFRFNGEI